ncbi:MAG: hypothetical protein CM1200mP1_04520 [Candidatus Neomarinimicrobiota bacterium]|nr:MAG: hypothetical protein CM1200mP1_04520 [Candidatus Neomarinimicrobiota bacterium]
MLIAQDENKEKFHFEFAMDSLEMNVGESKEVTIKLLNAKGGNLGSKSFLCFGQRKSFQYHPHQRFHWLAKVKLRLINRVD